jgi:hypothetical protein
MLLSKAEMACLAGGYHYAELAINEEVGLT